MAGAGTEAARCGAKRAAHRTKRRAYVVSLQRVQNSFHDALEEQGCAALRLERQFAQQGACAGAHAAIAFSLGG